jgi:hypothetical protein
MLHPLGLQQTHLNPFISHYSTNEICLQAAIINPLVIAYRLGGLFPDFSVLEFFVVEIFFYIHLDVTITC